MIIKLIYPDDLGKETEDEIIDWMRKKVKNPPPMISSIYSPFKYVEYLEIDR